MAYVYLWSASTSPHWNGAVERKKMMLTDNWYPHSEQVSTVVGEGAGHCCAIPVLSQPWQQRNQISTTFTLHWLLLYFNTKRHWDWPVRKFAVLFSEHGDSSGGMNPKSMRNCLSHSGKTSISLNGMAGRQKMGCNLVSDAYICSCDAKSIQQGLTPSNMRLSRKNL